MTLTALIVDDESLARRGLKHRLDALGSVTIVGEASNGFEACEMISELSPDLVCLEPTRLGMRGFELLEKLQGDNLPLIIFTTAYDQYAVDAFKVHAIDYLLKPVESDRLAEAVNRAAQRLSLEDTKDSKQALLDLMMTATVKHPTEFSDEPATSTDNWPEKLAIKDGSDISLVRVADIEWVDAAGDYMCVHANGATHIMRITMRQLSDKLNPAQFLRVHRSTIVNAELIRGAQALTNGEYTLSLSNGTKLKVSRSYRDTIKQFLSSH
ncbi:MAG: LytTR family DNA-binding domain-containing protein [Proteobacteria bacterium]|nr:LytTR family DNA-binding domain-containing protein [Pseudomonadota bacterium]